MCHSSTFFSQSNISSFFLVSLVSFDKRIVQVCGDIMGPRSWVMGIYLRPFNEASGLITDLLWWYRLFIYGGLCPIYFSRELGFGGFIIVLQVLYI